MNGQEKPTDPSVLTCWKEIAQYLGKGVRTVQRWERDFGMPVRRPRGVHQKSSVIAHPKELDAWMKTNWLERARADSDDPPDGLSSITNVDLHDLVIQSRMLRKTHAELRMQTSLALASLVSSCNELAAIKTLRVQLMRPWQDNRESADSGGSD